jgi:hypothetical protein
MLNVTRSMLPTQGLTLAKGFSIIIQSEPAGSKNSTQILLSSALKTASGESPRARPGWVMASVRQWLLSCIALTTAPSGPT